MNHTHRSLRDKLLGRARKHRRSLASRGHQSAFQSHCLSQELVPAAVRGASSGHAVVTSLR